LLKISVSGLLCLQHGTAGGMMAAETLTMTSTEALSAPRTAVTPAHLLVAVDFTRELGTVLRTAVALATRIGAKMTLLHVLEPITDDPEITLHWGDFPRERREHARQQLETLARESGAEAAELVLAEGRAFEEIVRNAQDRGCDLVVMGRTGEERGFIHEVLGSTVEKVARHARCPVFIVGEEQAPGPQEPRRILLPTDFSEDSRAAFAWAELIARQYDAKLLLANVQEPMGLPGTVEYRRFDDQIDALREEADERLETFRQEHLPVDLTVETHVVEGTPDRALCRLARREQVDLIVMSTHGAQGWRRAGAGRGWAARRRACCARCRAPCSWCLPRTGWRSRRMIPMRLDAHHGSRRRSKWRISISVRRLPASCARIFPPWRIMRRLATH
jgi:nucleotide-binding universal stress UspA family protein